LGYVEGKNLTVEARWAEGDLDRLPELARELAHLDVNVMFVGGDQGLRAAKEATTTIPIVVIACDPLDSLVASIARPGGKATGLTCISSDLAGKRLQLLKELVPALARVAVLYNPEDRNKASEYKQIQQTAGSLKLTLRAFEARSATEIDSAFAGMADDQAQGYSRRCSHGLSRKKACRPRIEGWASYDFWLSRIRRFRRSCLVWGEPS
jgi:putative ABC transport system substrate-binding protein